MKFVISISNHSDMAVRITTRILANAQWDPAFGFSTERRVSAWDYAAAQLLPVDEGLPYIRAVVDVFYDGLWVPGDLVRPPDGHVIVTLGYTLNERGRRGYVSAALRTRRLRTTGGQVLETHGYYLSDVTISPVPPERKPLPDIGLPPGGLG